jgi:tRNA(fMet)-specific endonuclease VapC
MDAVLLDTDVFSFLIRQSDTRGDLYRPHVKNKTVALSFISVGELYVWAAKKNWTPKTLAAFEERLKATVIVPYDLELCKEYGRIKAQLPAGRVVAANDLWIAVSAIRHSIPLLTHNRKHFEGIPELKFISESPATPGRPAQTGRLFEPPTA